MVKRFLDGLAFGAGFGVAFIVLWVVFSVLVLPGLHSSVHINRGEPVILERGDLSGTTPPSFDEFAGLDEMSVDEQIAAASVIAMARYETEPDGRRRAVISEIFKMEAGIEFRYDVGDEYHSLSYYPDEEDFRGDGNVIFFAGSPAQMRVAMSFRGDRITGLSNIPIELFRQKCAEAG